MKALYVIGLLLSSLVGVWHFFVPYLYQWSAYIPAEYESLMVGIDWINFFFSLLLLGYSALLLAMIKQVFGGSKELLMMYGFMVFVWLARIAITVIRPWPLDPVPWVSYGQQLASAVIFLLLFIPLVYLIRQRQKTLAP